MSFLTVFLFVACLFLYIFTCEASLSKVLTAKKQVKLALQNNDPGKVLEHARYLPQRTLRKVLKEQNSNVEAHAEASYELARTFTDKARAVRYVCAAYPYLRDKTEAIAWLSKQQTKILKEGVWRIMDQKKEPKEIRMQLEPLAKALPSPQITIMVANLLAGNEEANAMLLVELATGIPINKVSDMLYAAAKTQNVKLFNIVDPYCKVADYVQLTPRFMEIESIGMIFNALHGDDARDYVKLQWRELVQTGYYKSMLSTLKSSTRNELLEKHLSVAPDEESIAFVEALEELGAKRTRKTPIHEGWAKVFAGKRVSESTGMPEDIEDIIMEYY